MESRTQFKTVKITLNIFAVCPNLYTVTLLEAVGGHGQKHLWIIAHTFLRIAATSDSILNISKVTYLNNFKVNFRIVSSSIFQTDHCTYM